MIGMSFFSFLNWLHISIPSISGIMISKTDKSNLSVATFSKASLPVWALSVVNPSFSRWYVSNVTMDSSSSTISIFLVIFATSPYIDNVRNQVLIFHFISKAMHICFYCSIDIGSVTKQDVGLSKKILPLIGRDSIFIMKRS